MAINIVPLERRCTANLGIGVGGGLAGVLIDLVGYKYMFLIISVANILSIVIYYFFGRNHPSSMTYQIKRREI